MSNVSSHTNRLAHETSPYLLQHAHNPVDWYPWGDEAFETAREQGKPIFLSVGYSTCYWCHVMERESFENPAVAQVMNGRCINIKVDREERPDVDQLYMTAVQILTRHGGWPMSVFLTPDLKPFWGGTYFPPTDQHGRAGFVTIVQSIDEAYRNRRKEVEESADQIVGFLQQLAEPTPPAKPIVIDETFVDRLVERSIAHYDPVHGGFGSAPKFPQETLLELLLMYLSTLGGNPDLNEAEHDLRTLDLLKKVRHTLDSMAAGGIHDQLGGAFHRYSTDAQWLVPHFEIMLYDNALLAWIYVEAYRQTEEPRYAQIARGILDFILREMTGPAGTFYTAFDAEVDAREGDPYLWTAGEIEAILGAEDAAIFNPVYGMDRGPNFADPHHGTGQPDKSILYLPQPLETALTDLQRGHPNLKLEELELRLTAMRDKLYAARKQRKQPLLDTKVLTSWNALMIRALAYAGSVLQEPRYLDAGATAADFLLRHHRMPDGTLLRLTRPEGHQTKPIPGFLDDYAFLAQALVALWQATGKELWKDHAAVLTMGMIDRFGDETGGFYFTDEGASDLIVRQKVASDSPLPSGNAVAAMVLMDLDRRALAQHTLGIFARPLEEQAEAMSAMLQAALLYVRRYGPFTVAPPAGAAATQSDRPLSPQQIAEGVVSLSARWAEATTLELIADILDTFHLNAHEAAEGMIATQVAATGEAAGDVEAIDYPAGEERSFSFSDAAIRVYSDRVVFAIRFKTPQSGGKPIRLAMHYQACNDHACLPPVTKQVEIRME